MPTIETNGATIAYTDTGPRDAPTVVFGHSLLFGGWMFRPQVKALHEHYRCVTIDWRGQSETPPAPGAADMDTLTGDAVALIEHLGVAPVHWVGLSMGGFVGQRLAARHGELLRSLTLLDTSAAAEKPAVAASRKQLALFQLLFGIRPILGRIKPLLFGPTFLADPAAAPVIDEWVHRLVRFPRAGLRKAVIGVADRDAVEHEIARITVPTLVVVGTDDVATPVVEAERIAAGIPGTRLEIVAACGHTCTLEQPAVITDLLGTFLQDVTAMGCRLPSAARWARATPVWERAPAAPSTGVSGDIAPPGAAEQVGPPVGHSRNSLRIGTKAGVPAARAEEVARTVADPEAAAFEVEQVQREAGVRVTEAQSAQASAECDGREARRRAEQEAEQRAQADDAAQEALRELETVRAETAETVVRIAAETDARVAEQTARAEQAVADQAAAREELERVRVQAAEEVTAARADADQHRREVEADRDRQLAERAQAARGRSSRPVPKSPEPPGSR